MEAANKDQSAIITFFTNERTKLQNYLRSRMLDFSEMEIEDAISDLFESLLRKGDLVGQIENLAAYIYRAAVNRLTDTYRKRKHSISLESIQDNPNGKQIELPLNLIPQPEAEAIRENTKIQLYQAILKLEPKQRAVWVATEIEGYSFRELAETWGEPIGTLLARKHRATQALQLSLKNLKEELF